MKSKNGFSRCGELYIGRLQKEGRFSTAHVYKNALFLSVSFVVRKVCRSVRLRVSVCAVTAGILARAV